MSKVGLMDKPVSKLAARSSVVDTDRVAIFTATGTEPEMVSLTLLNAGGILDSNNTFSGVNTFTLPIVFDVNTGITALAAGGQTGATALAGQYNNVTTVASAFDSVKLPTAVIGETITVKNSGAAILSVFPFLADSIGAMAVNLSVDIPIGGEMTFRAISTTIWEINESLYLSAVTTQTGGIELKASDNAGNTIVTLTNASHGQATIIIFPDSGLATSYVPQSTAALTVAEVDFLDLSAQTETILTGAISVVKKITNLNTNAGAELFTLAAPDASMLGQVKVIHLVDDGGDATLTLTNVQGGSAATTCTWANVGEDLVLVAGVSKWDVISEGGVVLS